MSKLFRVNVEFLIDMGEVVGDTKELLEIEVNNMLYKLAKKFHPISISLTQMKVKDLNEQRL